MAGILSDIDGLSAMKINLQIQKLLDQANIESKVQSIVQLRTGGNNRTYQVLTPSDTYLVKEYFHHDLDDRDRLNAEFSFLSYANHVAPGWVPKVFACDVDNNLGLYQFINGVPVKPKKVVREFTHIAAKFFCKLNSNPSRKNAELPIASEASFSIDGHLQFIDDRLTSLLKIETCCPQNIEAIELAKKIKDKWDKIKEIIYRRTLDFNLKTNEELPMEYRCISPSDFGFHNALLNNGTLKFIDFEYAGWDDPAKMIGDFCTQLAVPVPEEYIDGFIRDSLSCFRDKDWLEYRTRLLIPAYQIKWCCIALNIFFQVNLERRKFANPDLDENLVKNAQITKAANLLQRIGELNGIN